jgi:hypothetical protein
LNTGSSSRRGGSGPSTTGTGTRSAQGAAGHGDAPQVGKNLVDKDDNTATATGPATATTGIAARASRTVATGSAGHGDDPSGRNHNNSGNDHRHAATGATATAAPARGSSVTTTGATGGATGPTLDELVGSSVIKADHAQQVEQLPEAAQSRNRSGDCASGTPGPTGIGNTRASGSTDGPGAAQGWVGIASDTAGGTYPDGSSCASATDARAAQRAGCLGGTGRPASRHDSITTGVAGLADSPGQGERVSDEDPKAVRVQDGANRNDQVVVELVPDKGLGSSNGVVPIASVTEGCKA